MIGKIVSFKTTHVESTGMIIDSYIGTSLCRSEAPSGHGGVIKIEHSVPCTYYLIAEENTNKLYHVLPTQIQKIIYEKI